MQKLSRREALRGTGVAALAAAVIPITSIQAADITADAEVLACGQECLKQAHEFRRLRRVSNKAAHKAAVAFAATNAQRWSIVGYFGSGPLSPVDGVPDAWQVWGVDSAPHWHARSLGEGDPESIEGKWFRLDATSKEEAEREANELDTKLDREFFAAKARAGIPFKSKEHFNNWGRAHDKMRRSVNKLAKLRATTPQGLNIKAMVLAASHDSWDDPEMWSDKLQASITADIKRNAAIAA